jgi:hypothetical protein
MNSFQELKISALMIRRVIIINDALVSDPNALASDPITCNRNEAVDSVCRPKPD